MGLLTYKIIIQTPNAKKLDTAAEVWFNGLVVARTRIIASIRPRSPRNRSKVDRL